MVKSPNKVVLDTNVIISALGFGGKPRLILLNALDNKIKAIISPLLMAELEDVINKKFPNLSSDYSRIEKMFLRKFKVVHPKKNNTYFSG